MSYPISLLVYGVPYTPALNQAADGLLEAGKIDAWGLGEELGFKLLYDGSVEEIPGYLGVVLARNNVTWGYKLTVECSFLGVHATDEQKQEAQKMYDALPKGLKDILKTEEIEGPGYWTIWHTS